MVYRHDLINGTIEEVTPESARTSLKAYGWTDWSIENFFRSGSGVISTHFFNFSRSRSRLEETANEVAVV